MSEELDKWAKADLERDAGQLLDSAKRLEGLFETYSSVLETDQSVDDKPTEVIPEFTFDHYEKDAGRRLSGSAYFFRPKTTRHNRHPEILCSIKLDAQSNDAPRRLSLNPAYGIASDLDELDRSFEEPELFSTILDAAERVLARRQIAREEERAHSRHSFVGFLALIAALGGAAFGIDRLIVSREAASRHQNELRQAFDRSGFRLPGQAVAIGEYAIRPVPDATYKKIPTYRKHDTLLSARRVKVSEGCKSLKVSLQADDEILLSAKASDLTADGGTPIMAGRDSAGDLFLCQKSGDMDWSQLAVQIVR